jgi:hypothetical protein
MRIDYRAALLFMSVVLAVTTLCAVGTSAQVVDEKTPPPRPPWINADGKLNMDKAPREVPSVGSDGKVVKETNGQVKMVPSYIVTIL